MRLGNSQGQNTGKKYFTRNVIATIVPQDKNRMKADDFKNWFGKNYRGIVLQLRRKEAIL